MDLVEQLKEIAEKRGFSADTLSKFIGCSARQVDRWLLGESHPTPVYQALIKKAIKKINQI